MNRARRGGGQFRHRVADASQPRFADAQRNQIRLREIAIIVRVFLAAHAHRFARSALNSRVSCITLPPLSIDGHLPLDLVIQRHLQEPERIEILHFGLGAELLRALQPHADVGVAAQMALFHVASGDLHVLQHLLELGQVGVGFVGAAHVGLAHDFNQRRAAAVQIHVGVAVGVLETVMNALAGIVFHVDARDADALLLALTSMSTKPCSARG